MGDVRSFDGWDLKSVAMGTPIDVSAILATLPGGKAEEVDKEPDWLQELEEDELSKEVCFWVHSLDVHTCSPPNSDRMAICTHVYATSLLNFPSL